VGVIMTIETDSAVHRLNGNQPNCSSRMCEWRLENNPMANGFDIGERRLNWGLWSD